jgi:hypothetical protein
MEVIASLIEMCCSKSVHDEETAILRARIREKAVHCHVDELHILTANSTLFNHDYSGPSTYESIVSSYAKKGHYKSFKPLLKVLSTLYREENIRNYTYILITINNTYICLRNIERTPRKSPLIALYDCNTILSVPAGATGANSS